MYERIRVLVVPNNAMDLSIALTDAYTVRGRIQDKEFIYAYTCDVAPRFIGYNATPAETQFLKKTLDMYLSTDECRNIIAEMMFN